MTPRLFHGPSARDKAVLMSEELGRPISEPIGDNGLRVDDSRKIVDYALNPGVGDKPPTLVVGPLEASTPEASDALLKTLEDLSSGPLKVILWANHLSEVIPTIRSRTLAEWCPPGKAWIDPLGAWHESARDLCQAIKQEDLSKILGCFEEIGQDWPQLMEALCEHLAKEVHGPDHEKVLLVWMEVRKILRGKGSTLCAIDAVLPPL